MAGGVVSGGLGMLGSVVSKTVSDATSTNSSVTDSFSTVKGSSDGITDTTNYGISKTEGYTKGMSEGMTLTFHDKSVEDILERINKQLKRIDDFESLGMYECAAYFMSDKQCAAEAAASTYKALMRGENSGVEIAAINSWNTSPMEKQNSKVQMIEQYVKNFIHPVFRYNGSAGYIEVTPCSLVSGNELAIHMGLPRHSVCGLPVIEHADFGKEVITYDGKKSLPGIKLGKVFNMGSVSKNDVSLNLNSLAMHTFITGSTGSGKSNTIYEMVRQLINTGKKFLIIEPAKGEYKNVFGNQSDVRVLGTNPQFSELLRVNPFRFPKGIHVLEHIDRLIEIFNVCWPMYAAMPAVLKDAILQSYESCGWDLVESTNRYNNELFPTFSDLLNQLVDVIQRSDYSDEVKACIMDPLIQKQYESTFQLSVSNHRGEINVTKAFKNAGSGEASPVSGNYKFGLYENADGTNGSGPSGKSEEPLQTVTITYNAGETETKTAKFVDLELNKTYYVFELDDKGKPIKDPATVAVINGMEYFTSYYTTNTASPTVLNSAESGDTVTVINQSRVKELPSTGGYGVLIYRLAGAICIFFAGLLLLKNKLQQK